MSWKRGLRHSNAHVSMFKQKINAEQTPKNLLSLLPEKIKIKNRLSPTAVFGDCQFYNVRCHITSFTELCKTTNYMCKHFQRRPRSSPYCSRSHRASDKTFLSQQRY